MNPIALVLAALWCAGILSITWWARRRLRRAEEHASPVGIQSPFGRIMVGEEYTWKAAHASSDPFRVTSIELPHAVLTSTGPLHFALKLHPEDIAALMVKVDR